MKTINTSSKHNHLALTNFHFSSDRTFEHSDEAQATNYEFWLNLLSHTVHSSC